ncbi:MAG: tRNA epoxyqueuosine(34) reductase QueG [Verrucomicrobiota bacterium]
MEPLILKQQLLAKAQELGFDVCRVAPATVPPHAEAFRAWLAAGKAGEMTWLAKNADKRTNPDLVLQGVRSIVIVAKSYTQPAPINASAYQIARYAFGADYHDILTPRIRELESVLEAVGGLQRSYVDTGPVLERDFAALAGVGWQGKSTMLISRELGAFFFLGALLSTIELPPDTPTKDRCGSCTRCIDVCPTSAITAPHHLDATRCVAYLTIELKGSIPEEFRRQIGNRIYGCDDCSAVCPWNRFAKVSTEAQFQAQENHLPTNLREFLSLTDDSFRALFRGSPIKRIKRRGFLRNVCVALGNTGTELDLPALQQATLDPEPLIQEHALWAIAEIQRRTV